MIVSLVRVELTVRPVFSLIFDQSLVNRRFDFQDPVDEASMVMKIETSPMKRLTQSQDQ